MTRDGWPQTTPSSSLLEARFRAKEDPRMEHEMTLERAGELLETCERCRMRGLVGGYCPYCHDYVPSVLQRMVWMLKREGE